jgi:hypothetical protein
MFVKDRRGGRNWAPGVFATFWILLAAFSAAYLFRIVSEPIPSQSAASAATPAADDETAALNSGSQAEELAALKASLRDLSQQVAELNARIKSMGPVAMATPGGAVTPPPSEPQPMLPAENPADLAKAPETPAPAKPEAKAPGKPAEAPKAAEEAKAPEKPAKPVEKPIEEAKADTSAPAKPDAKSAEPIKPPTPVANASEPQPSEELPPAVVVSPAPEDKPAAEKPAEKAAAVAAPEEKPAAEKPAEPGQLSANEPTAIPTPGPSPAASAAAEGVETANLTPPIALPPGTTRFGIEIGNVEKQDGVRSLWRDLLTNHAALVAGLEARRVLAPDKKWRLVAGPFANAAEATQACGLFKKANLPCEATVFAGDQL